MYTMQFKLRPLPHQYGPLLEASSYSLLNQDTAISPPYNLIRLHNEKNILSKGLADCVTYLNALREKQARNARRLNMEPPAPQKKRKSLQQIKRHLDNEIRNRERDEQAFLNNLQACETNIFLANMQAHHLTNALFHAPELTSKSTLYTPTACSDSGSETTDLTWDGWTDDALVSPFEKKGTNPFFVDDVAPDACAEDLRRKSAVTRDVKRPPPLSQDAVELSNSLPAPPNTAQSQFRRSSILSPAAAVFKPTYSPVIQQRDCSDLKFKRLSMSSLTATKAVELLQRRRLSAAEMVPILQHFTIDECQPPQHVPGQTWCHKTPPTSPQEDAGVRVSRQRTNSL